MKKAAQSFNAVTLRTILIVLLILVIGLSSVGFYFGFNWVKSYAAEVNTAVTNAHANTGPTTSASTKSMEATLATEAPVIAKLALFYASPSDYQTKAIQDIDAYAQKSGLSIGDVTTGASSTAPKTTSLTPTATSPASASGASLNVKLTAPVSYTSLMKFITYIQNNLPKMQVQSLTLQHTVGGKADTVGIDSLTINVVTR